jgi:hypothetical protein
VQNPTYVLPGIQRLDPARLQFPKDTQVRYFRNEDEKTATDMAMAVSKITPAFPKFINLKAERLQVVPRHQFEVWVGTGTQQ